MKHIQRRPLPLLATFAVLCGLALTTTLISVSAAEPAASDQQVQEAGEQVLEAGTQAVEAVDAVVEREFRPRVVASS